MDEDAMVFTGLVVSVELRWMKPPHEMKVR